MRVSTFKNGIFRISEVRLPPGFPDIPNNSQVIRVRASQNPSSSFHVYPGVSSSRGEEQPDCILITASGGFSLLAILSPPPQRNSFTFPVFLKKVFMIQPDLRTAGDSGRSAGYRVKLSDSQPLMEPKPRLFSASLLLQRELRLLPHWSLS